MRNGFAAIAFFSVLLTSCVESNLDNAFDPQFPLGMAVGLELSGSGSSSTSSESSTDTTTPTTPTTPAASVCNRTTSLTVYQTSAGTYPATISAGAAEVEILVIGGGGGGGSIDVARDWVTTTSLDGFPGGTSYVEISGGATLVSATGGSGGIHSQGANPHFAPAVTGTGGAGGTPGGVAGGVAPYGAGTGTVGTLAGYWAGQGGLSAAGGSFGGWTWFGGGSGGSGGMDTVTRTDLAGANLNVIIGAGGAGGTSADGFSGTGNGTAGYAYILESDAATVAPCDAYSPFFQTYGYGHGASGVFNYTVPADARAVEIFAIGAGGGGGTIDVARDGVTSTQLDGFSGGDTSVAINGGATLLTAPGGAGGTAGRGSLTTYAPATQGLGGAGGLPGGVDGSDGPLNAGNASGGSLTNFQAGAGGTGASAGALWGGWYGGGGGGSGAMASTTRTDLAGVQLDITIGAGGAAGTSADGTWNVTAGTDGYVHILIY